MQTSEFIGLIYCNLNTQDLLYIEIIFFWKTLKSNIIPTEGIHYIVFFCNREQCPFIIHIVVQ